MLMHFPHGNKVFETVLLSGNFVTDTLVIRNIVFDNYKKAVLSQRWPRDARYVSRSWAVADIWPFEIIQDGGGRHLEFVRIENSAIRSAVFENPTL